jgi:hypothetical protein
MPKYPQIDIATHNQSNNNDRSVLAFDLSFMLFSLLICDLRLSTRLWR